MTDSEDPPECIDCGAPAAKMVRVGWQRFGLCQNDYNARAQDVYQEEEAERRYQSDRQDQSQH